MNYAPQAKSDWIKSKVDTSLYIYMYEIKKNVYLRITYLLYQNHDNIFKTISSLFNKLT